ncbi:hypothetical protein BH23GEM9_BH23GEM9_00800 [soil metagenome]
MSWDRRPEDETPRMETRTFTDGEGRRWSGSIVSGRFAGGEKQAEVIFVCEDAPSEAKRFTRLDKRPQEAADEWKSMDEARVQALFGESETA